jgi:tetratricopeptide (TPR) repeat protein
MKSLALACCIGLLTISTCAADDFAIVTSEQAYLLDDNGDVAETVPFHTVLDVGAEQAGRLRVVRDNHTLWLHKGFVHLGSQFAELSESDRLALREVYNHLERAARKADDERYEEAIALVQEATQVAANDLTEPLPFAAWTRQYEAYLYYSQGANERANQILDDLNASANMLAISEHLLTADLYNVRGLLSDASGDLPEATKQFEQAITILVAQRNGQHLDLATLYDNLADTLVQAGAT